MITYCTALDVENFADSHGFDEWNTIDQAKQKRIVLQATLDIENYSNIKRENGVPFGYGSQELTDAGILQCIYLINTYSYGKMQEKMSAVTTGSFSDTIINVENTSGTKLSTNVQKIVNDYLIENSESRGNTFVSG